MTLEQAMEYLKEWIQPDGTLYSGMFYVKVTEHVFVIDSEFCGAEMCMALAVYCNHKGWHQ